MVKNNRKSSRKQRQSIRIVYAILLLSILFFIWYFYSKSESSKSENFTQSSSINESSQYIDNDYKFKVDIPDGWHHIPTFVSSSGDVFPGSTLTMTNYDIYNPEVNYQKNDINDYIQNPIKIDIAISTDNKQSLEEVKNEWSQLIGSSERGKANIISVQETNLSNLPAIEVLFSNKSRYEIILLGKNGYKYRLAFYDFDYDFTEEDNLFLQQILSSFKVLDY